MLQVLAAVNLLPVIHCQLWTRQMLLALPDNVMPCSLPLGK